MDGMTATLTLLRGVWEYAAPVVGTALAKLAQDWMSRRRARRMGCLT